MNVPEFESEFNTPQSGHGPSTVIPSDIQRWSWGACLFHWVWGLFNNTFIALLCIIPIISFPMMIVLGIKGNEWAWRNKKWESIEHFHKIQKRWAIAAICCWTLLVFGTVGGIATAVVVIQKTLSGSKPYKVAVETAKSNPSVVSTLGEEISETGFPQGSINLKNSSGECDLQIGLKGSKGEGTLYVKGIKEAGVWTFSMIKFGPKNSDTRIDLLKDLSNSEKTIIDPSQPIKMQ